MSAVIRKVQHRLETMVGAVGGKKGADALAHAAANLETIAPPCREQLDASLAVLVSYARTQPAAQPTDTDIAALLAEADVALTACGGLDEPLIGQALMLFCSLADAVRHMRARPAGALTPALNLISMLQSGRADDAVFAVVLPELERCLAHFERQG